MFKTHFLLLFNVFSWNFRFVHPVTLFLQLFFRLAIRILLLFSLGLLDRLLFGLEFADSFFLLVLPMKGLFGVVSFLVTVGTSFASVVLLDSNFVVGLFDHVTVKLQCCLKCWNKFFFNYAFLNYDSNLMKSYKLNTRWLLISNNKA